MCRSLRNPLSRAVGDRFFDMSKFTGLVSQEKSLNCGGRGGGQQSRGCCGQSGCKLWAGRGQRGYRCPPLSMACAHAPKGCPQLALRSLVRSGDDFGGNRENGKNRALSTLTPVLRSTTPDAEGFAQVALCQFSGAANNSGACNLLLFADNPTIGRFAHREEKAWRPKRLTTPP